MKEVTVKDYNKFIKTHKEIVIEDRIGKKKVYIQIGQPHKLKTLQPKNFVIEPFTTWSFPKRSAWATHKGNYR
ncbi:MAG: DNA methylase, partial [Candidatus Aminicenantes bacterium]|nr:DNA methylase [Candidatus Aminicenantes bacterium]